MENVIDKLMEIEYRAQKITTEAKEKEKNLSEQIKKKQEDLEKVIYEQYEKKLNETKKREILDEQQKSTEIENNKLKQLETLQKSFNQYHVKWENDLFNSIIGW